MGDILTTNLPVEAKYPSQFKLLRTIEEKLCSWGRKRPYSDVDSNSSKGKNTAPLWKNKNAKSYNTFFISNVIATSLLVLLLIIMAIKGKKSNCDLSPIKPLLNIIGICFCVGNSLISKYLCLMSYASDQEWFRLTLINGIFCIALLIYTFFETFLFVKALKKVYIEANPAEQILENCRKDYKINLWMKFVVIVIVVVINFFQLFILVKTYISLFTGKKVLQIDSIPLSTFPEGRITVNGLNYNPCDENILSKKQKKEEKKHSDFGAQINSEILPNELGKKFLSSEQLDDLMSYEIN